MLLINFVTHKNNGFILDSTITSENFILDQKLRKNPS